MPLYDYKFLLSDAQAVMTAADEYSTNYVDFGYADPNVGRGGKFGLHLVVTTAFTGLDSGCNVWIVDGTTTSPTTKTVARFLAVASLTAGAHFYIPGPHSLQRYVRCYYDLVSEVATAGAFTAWLGPDEDGAV